MNELSVVAKTRIREYQRAVSLGDPDLIEDAEGKLLALGIDPGEALTVRVGYDEIAGDR